MRGPTYNLCYCRVVLHKRMCMKKVLLILGSLLAIGCTSNPQTVYIDVVETIGVEGVMPTIGKIYVDNVIVGASDGTATDMRKAHLIYTLSADIVLDDYSIIDNGTGKCNWESLSSGTTFQNATSSNGSSTDSKLYFDEVSKNYVCEPVMIDFTKQGTETDYDPDSLVSLSFTDDNGNKITRVGSDTVYTTNITLNTADRHNVITVATSPTTVLLHRKDGLFQSGFTAYRGMSGLNKYIGSATYEAYVKTPGSSNSSVNANEYAQKIEEDNKTINEWLTNGTINVNVGIYSNSSFVSNYGPAIALPPFRSGEIDYRKLRLVLMRHNNNPIIISNDKKLYTMGHVTNYLNSELNREFAYFTRQNDNWFSYSGVSIRDNSDTTKFHVGEIKPVNGVEAKFVSTLSVTSDLGTIISLNETDKEYYIAGNPFYNASFCKEGKQGLEVFDVTTNSFNFNTRCTYSSESEGSIGAVKIPGLQKLIGDGSGVIATDTKIFFIGKDGRGYEVNLMPGSENYNNILNNLPVKADLIRWTKDDGHTGEGMERLYVTDIGFPNMNPVVTPTLLLNDGSIIFAIREVVENNGKTEIVFKTKHFYINEDLQDNHSQGDLKNVRITQLLGPTLGYGENGKIYYFTDVPALGVSYAPKKDNATDNDYLAYVLGDPVQMLDSMQDKSKFFQFKYGILDINSAIKNVDSTAEMKDFILLPYNPHTDVIEDVQYGESDNVTYSPVKYKPFRTNAHLFVNTSANAKYNYIVVPSYVYAFDTKDRVERETWIEKKDGLMAAEIRHNDISKVFGAFNNPTVPFKYTPYGRNTAFFANKKGIFAFTGYDVRNTRSGCPDNPSDTACTGVFTSMKSDTIPDYFYRAKSTQYYEEASGRNNYVSTAFVQESRMANYPSNSDFRTNGFEPQLLSSWIPYETTQVPSTVGNVVRSVTTLASIILPTYIPQYWYTSLFGKNNLDLGTDAATFFNGLNQYSYGIGLYRHYSTQAFPFWRARKLSSEILQYQARYGLLLPMTSGPTANNIFKAMTGLFNDGPNISNNGGDTLEYVTPRMYAHGLYAFYDKENLSNDSMSIDQVILGGQDIINTRAGTALSTSDIGYIMDKGNFMWRSGTKAAMDNSNKAVSTTSPLNNIEYFSDFVIHHNN